MASKFIEQYRLQITEGTPQKAYISCWANGEFQGYMDFYEPGNVPKPRITPNGSFHIPYPVDRLDAVLSTLREESPLYLQIITIGNIVRGVLSTTQEPVGEEEGI